MYLRRVRTLMDELLKAAPMGTGAPAPSPGPAPTPRPVRVAVADAELGHYEPRIDELLAQIGPDAALDNAKWNSNAWGNGSTAPNYPQSYADAVKELSDWYLPERRRQLFNRLSSGTGELPDAQPAGTIVMFGAVEGTLPTGNPDEAYIQLLNPNSFAVDISGWTLSLGLNPPTPIFTFRGGTVVPAGGTLYVAANRPAFRARRRSPTGGQALFIVGDFTGQVPARGASLSLTDRQGVTVASTSR
jgi:hypothetical protein